MQRETRIAQSGANTTTNEFALQNGQLAYAINADFQRPGIVQRRTGFSGYYNGQPNICFEADGTTASARGHRGTAGKFHELFAGLRLFQYHSGMMMTIDDQAVPTQPWWASVPVHLSHRWRLIYSSSAATVHTYGNMVVTSSGLTSNPSQSSGTSKTLSWLNNANWAGVIANDPSDAKDYRTAYANAPSHMVGPFDADVVSSVLYITDKGTLRKDGGQLAAGSLTASSVWDGTKTTFTTSLFTNLQWCVAYSSKLYATENGTELLSFTPAGSTVALVAGSSTSGTADGTTGTSSTARFTSLNGLCSAGDGRFFVIDGHRVRIIDTISGQTHTIAGSTTSGYVNGGGATARFNTPTGISFIGAASTAGILFLADTNNHLLRTVTFSAYPPTSTADTTVADYYGNGTATPYTVAGAQLTGAGSITSPVLRGLFTSEVADSACQVGVIECTANDSAIEDVVFVTLYNSGSASGGSAYHVARCPATAPSLNGPNKLDSFGPNPFGGTAVRATDVGSGAAFTSESRLMSLDLYTRTTSIGTMPRLRPTGVDWPEAPSPTAGAAAGIVLANNSQCAYRVVHGLNLTDGRIVLGPPSERIVLNNTSGSITNPSVTIFAPPAMPYDGSGVSGNPYTGLFYQLYRTLTVVNTTDPGDQMFLANEGSVSYGDAVTVSDTTPDSLLGADLYTNATDSGIAASSFPPSYAPTDVALFDNRLVISGARHQAVLRFKLLAAAASAGDAGQLVAISTESTNSTANVGGFRMFYNVGGANAFASGTVTLPTSGSAATNVTAGVRNIVNCINRYPDAFAFRATVDPDDSASFIVYCIVPGATGYALVYNTNLIEVSSDTDSLYANRIDWSDQFAFDSFPAVNELPVGYTGESVRRVLPISDSAIVVKDKNLYRLTQDFNLQIFDTALAGGAHDSFAKLQNAWIGLFDSGVYALTSSGKQPVSPAMFQTLKAYLRPGFVTEAYGASVEQTGMYLLTIAPTNIKTMKTFALRLGSQDWSEWQLAQYTDNDETRPAFGMGIVGSWQGNFFFSLQSALKQARSTFRQRDFRNWNTVGTAPFGVFSIDYSDFLLKRLTSNDGLATSDGTTFTFVIPSITNLTGGPLEQLPNGASMIGAAAYFSDGSSGNFARVYSATVSGLSGTISVTPAVSASMTSVRLVCPILLQADISGIFTGALGQFGDSVFTVERVQGGTITTTFYNRRDLADPTIPILSGKGGADVRYASGQGISRTSVLAEVGTIGGGEKMTIGETIRVPVPSQRATDEWLAIRFQDQKADAPLAIKALVVEVAPTGSTKVTQ